MPFPDLTPTLPTLFRTTAERFGSRPFLIVGDERLSYGDADARSAELACGLLARGVSKGTHVGLLMPNSVDWVLAWFAVARIGAVAVPLNTFSQAGELGWLLRHGDVAHVLAHPRFLSHDYQERLEAAVPGLAEADAAGPLRLTAAPLLRGIDLLGATDRAWSGGDVDGIVAAGRDAGIDGAFLAEVEACVVPADPAIIVYTSGSTGDPKGCVHSQGNVVRQSYNLTFSYLVGHDDVLFSSMPFFWIGGLITALHAVQHHGACLVTQSAFEPGEALALIEEHRATIAQGWPQQGTTLRNHPSYGDRDVSSIRRTSMPDLVAPGRRPPAVRSDSLGMTETCGSHTNFDPYVALDESKRGTFGPSVDGFEHRVIDPETGDEVPAGTDGEICIRGGSMMLGLHRRERGDVFDADGWLPTGDGGHLDADGWLFYTGRLGDMIKTGGGTNITPGEVERALVAFDEVQEAYVVGAPTADGSQVVTAAVVLADGAVVEADELRRRLKDTISAYKIPKHVWLCQKADLPFTTTGKLKKMDLATLMAARLNS